MKAQRPILSIPASRKRREKPQSQIKLADEMSVEYRQRIAAIHKNLGISADYSRAHKLSLQPEATNLIPIGQDINSRPQKLAPHAAACWKEMRTAAMNDNIELLLVSAFRSVVRQQEIIERKLRSGVPLGDILKVVAAPGYSEHHSGRALDLTATGCPPVSEDFERTDAFCWLTRNAAAFGFHLSYPRDNIHGVVYEPWHWAIRADPE